VLLLVRVQRGRLRFFVLRSDHPLHVVLSSNPPFWWPHESIRSFVAGSSNGMRGPGPALPRGRAPFPPASGREPVQGDAALPARRSRATSNGPMRQEMCFFQRGAPVCPRTRLPTFCRSSRLTVRSSQSGSDASRRSNWNSRLQEWHGVRALGGCARVRSSAIAQGRHDRDSSPSPDLGPVPRPRVTPGLQTRRVELGPHERLLPVREVALRLAVSRATVYRLCTQGKLPHVRVANSIRVRPGQIPGFEHDWQLGA